MAALQTSIPCSLKGSGWEVVTSLDGASHGPGSKRYSMRARVPGKRTALETQRTAAPSVSGVCATVAWGWNVNSFRQKSITMLLATKLTHRRVITIFCRTIRHVVVVFNHCSSVLDLSFSMWTAPSAYGSSSISSFL